MKTTTNEDGTKRCGKCGETKPLGDFPTSKSKRFRDGVYPYCSPCRTEYSREYARKRRAKDSKGYRDSHYRRKYGISADEVKDMHRAVKNRCEICDDWHDTLSVDHCHSTGKVRGLLCKKCNLALGGFGDDPEKIKKALKYLLR